MNERPARLAVGVISAGRVGAVLGAALANAGHQVVATSAVSAESRNRAAELLPGAQILPADQVAALADVVLLAIPDDELPGLVSGLVATQALRPGQILAHTCGAHGVAVLNSATQLGILPLALHPIMTFTGRQEDIHRLVACPIGITAPDQDESAWHVAEALVLEMGAEPVRIPESARPLYHAALAHGANHLTTLINDCLDLLHEANVASPERLLSPLLSAALDNSLRLGDRALTGPVARGDISTIKAHLNVLRAQAPDVLTSYRVLAQRTATRAKQAGLLGSDQADAAQQALTEESA